MGGQDYPIKVPETNTQAPNKEESVKTIGDLAKAYEKYSSEKDAKYNVKAIKIKEGAKIKVIEGKKNWKETFRVTQKALHKKVTIKKTKTF